MDPKVSKFIRHHELLLGFPPRVEKTRLAQLPRHLDQNYEFYTVTTGNTRFLLAFDLRIEEVPPSAVQKQLEIMKSVLRIPVVYSREVISTYNRHRLIQKHIPFVVPGTQWYLPMIGMEFKERVQQKSNVKGSISPVTQVLLLYVLLTKTYRVITPGDMVTALGYSLMSINRAFRELEYHEVGTHSIQPRRRTLIFGEHGRELWEKTSPLMRSPVRKSLPAGNVSLPLAREKWKAGITALAQYSLLSPPERPVYACGPKVWARHRQESALSSSNLGSEADLEIWSYNPGLLASGEVVDRLSLYLTLKDDPDERVQDAFQTMLEQFPW